MTTLYNMEYECSCNAERFFNENEEWSFAICVLAVLGRILAHLCKLRQPLSMQLLAFSSVQNEKANSGKYLLDLDFVIFLSSAFQTEIATMTPC